MKFSRFCLVCLISLMLSQVVFCQTAVVSSEPAGEVVSKVFPAVNYKVLGGDTKVDLMGTELMPSAKGEAKVQSKPGYARIEATVEGLESPTKFGAEYLTYVLWSVSTEGAAKNLGEFILENGKGKLDITTNQQVFALGVTAEPYFSVRRPSDVVVLLNQIRKNTKGSVFHVDTKTELLRRGHYAKMANPLGLSLDLKSNPIEIYEARNALQVAKYSGAEKYASDILSRAEASLEMADRATQAKKEKKEIATFARQAVQFAEDARALSVERQEQEAKQRDLAEKEAAEKGRLQAELDAQKASAERAKAEEQAKLEAEQRAQAEAAEKAAREQAEKAEREKSELRAKLLTQFNSVLETRDSERGLVVNMGDVLFDTGKYDLRPTAREKLARLAGIVLNYPGLKLRAEGHTDSTGSDELNQKLSEERAKAVQSYLVSQGVSDENIGSTGLGKTMPIASNDTSQGRQQNRRVELIVSGEVIGTKVGN